MTDNQVVSPYPPLDSEGWTCPLPLRDYPTIVTARTGIGGTRVVDVPAGELLPRIC